MTQLSEAVTRYNKIIESGAFKDLEWAEALRQRMTESGLVVGVTPVCPVLRPHFLSSRQYNSLTKASETLLTSINRVKQMALATPSLQARMELLPAEKMLASIDPGYSQLSVAALLDTYVNNGSLRFMEYVSDAPMGIAYGEVLSNLFLESGPVKELKKRFALSKMPGSK